MFGVYNKEEERDVISENKNQIERGDGKGFKKMRLPANPDESVLGSSKTQNRILWKFYNQNNKHKFVSHKF